VVGWQWLHALRATASASAAVQNATVHVYNSSGRVLCMHAQRVCSANASLYAMQNSIHLVRAESIAQLMRCTDSYDIPQFVESYSLCMLADSAKRIMYAAVEYKQRCTAQSTLARS
jgi:hypothetical protein